MLGSHLLYKLGWDLTGSEFAGRHQLYEKFYAGNAVLVRASCDREAPWSAFHAIVDGLLEHAGEGIKTGAAQPA
jgi:4-hydroxyphenylacetate 3-monooxygenase